MARKKVKLIHSNTTCEREAKASHGLDGLGDSTCEPKRAAYGTRTPEQKREQLAEMKRRERARKRAMGLKIINLWLPAGDEHKEAEARIKRYAELVCERAARNDR